MKWALWGGLLGVVLVGCFFGNAALAGRVKAVQHELNTLQQAAGRARMEATEPAHAEGRTLRVRAAVLEGMVAMAGQQASFLDLLATRRATAFRQDDKGNVEVSGLKGKLPEVPGLVDVQASEGTLRGRWER